MSISSAASTSALRSGFAIHAEA